MYTVYYTYVYGGLYRHIVSLHPTVRAGILWYSFGLLTFKKPTDVAKIV